MKSTRSTLVSSLLLSASTSTLAASIFRRALEVPTDLPGNWEYQGCWVDIGRTLKDAAYADNVGMTGQTCISFCSSKGFQYAGTEYSQECYCGSKIQDGATQAPEADCKNPCKGDINQPCGAGSRLTLYYSSTPVGPQPNPGVNGYGYKGCYTEGTTGRTLTSGVGSIPSNEMTVEKCVTACKTGGFSLAGVEYGGECFCGNTISNGGVPASSGCSMLCNGNENEFCGGPSRLNIYDANIAVGPSSSAPGVPSSSTTRPASSSSVTTSRTTTVSTVPSSSATTTVRTSSVTTTSRTSSVTTTRVTTTTTTTSAASTPTAPSQPATVGTWTWYGCQTEGTGIRALNSKTTAADTMTLETCATFCSGFAYFGVEYARECYCGNKFEVGSVAAPAKDCSFGCSGNKWQLCGAGNRLSVYTSTGGSGGSSSSSSSSRSSSSSSSSSNRTTTSVSSTVSTSRSVSSSVTTTTTRTTTTTTTSRTTTTTAVTVSGLPAGWSYQGCWIDGVQGRILSNQQPDSLQMTPQVCARACLAAGYSISGTEWAQQCFCGNSIINSGKKTADAECNTPCAGDGTQMCGAGGRMSIVSNGPPTVILPPAPQTGGLGSWTYQGCYQDNVNQKRTFPWQMYFPGVMTPKMCLDRCAQYGYMAAGLEYGEECYCGDPQNVVTRGAAKVAETECGVLCAGNSSAYCGGGSRLTTYFWTGTPFYSWDFPQTAAGAGRYEFLVNGACIPLMTSETITGKVTFLSKWGTGPAGETGAYELDLQTLQFRTMHVKTDVFCAAGITLPDKGGRQLTIGGWSGDSTEGVRLYYPDGSPGVPGVRDWQENVNQLSLEVGRWYPTAMIMANGSVMVIGGQVGSNGAAVPSIEVLPRTGAGPQHMDWLQRTDPNNLYPFPAVLPGGGILVVYYNEARILDARTFATIRTLPNIPGAVNNDLAGRTYPLEGTAVLLPQKGPAYNDLGVLLCGGSSNGASNALDNCVSMYPEQPGAQWTIERMPSPRVMPCMAPLPDGTYFIGNGAQHGVAGFGLAIDPNLNSLIYDPSKPIGRRITVAANTTIARMYHSEAITLLDGRVLISGSDPEDGVNPQEYRVEVYIPPYLASGKTRPTFTLANKDWAYGSTISFSYTAAGHGAISVTLLGSVSNTHGNSMGARTLLPQVNCGGGTCSFQAPPNANACPPGWYQFFVVDGGIPAKGVYVRIGGDPGAIGNWPSAPDFTKPGI